jgi:uncharacterized protein
MKRIFFLLILSGIIFHGCNQKLLVTEVNSLDQNESQKGRRAEVLFLGHSSKHHDSGRYAPWLATALFPSGINITYTETTEDLNKEYLSKFDALLIYANHDYLSPDQELAMKDFLEGGKGLIPLHSATGCFKNSEWYIQTIGGQFDSHGVGTFKSRILMARHPVTQGLEDFETWDETYIHRKINPDIEILMERIEGDIKESDSENKNKRYPVDSSVKDGHREPYTWVREQGKGRVFYTAYGHDERTWQNPGFLKLLEKGIFWALGDSIREQVVKLDLPNVSIYEEPISDFTKRYEVPKIQEPLSPEESQKLIQTPVDFEIQLFASEPDITNPIAMAWDERGRLWIVESVDYPNTFKETDGQANDRIKICEDTNGDGKADKFTVFADGLNIPTSLVFSNGGVIVSMAPDFVFMKDTNGDDKADVREVIMTGWGKSDTHAGPSNLQYGFDNKIWGVTGYSGFKGNINGKPWSFPQGIYHFRPDGQEFDFLANSSNNTWGLGFSEDNNVFISTANNTHAAYYSIPSKYLQRAFPTPGEGQTAPPFNIQSIQKIDGHYDAHSMTPNLRQVDVVGGFTSAAGFKLYTARDFPEYYWNRIAFVNEPTIRLTHNAIIQPLGAGFTEKDGWNLLASSDEWFAPVQAEVGPDGAVWIADWYNFIIQHNVFVERQAPSKMVLPFTDQPHGQGNAFHSELRDTNHGRIYRVVYKNAKPHSPKALNRNDYNGLLLALKDDNMFWRMTAQRLLVESGNHEVLQGLYEIIKNREVDVIGLNSPAVHALWTLKGLNVLEGNHPEAFKIAVGALTHPASGVRKAAAAVLPSTAESFNALNQSGIIWDKDLNVRMHAILALTSMPTSSMVGELLYQASLDSENEKDDWLTKAIFAATTQHETHFLRALDKGGSSGLSNRLKIALASERYEMGRRSNLLHSPDVEGKELILSANVSSRGDEKPYGVIAAHGRNDNGYCFYLEEGKLHFLVVQNGIKYQVNTTVTLPTNFSTSAHLQRDGKMSIQINGEEAAHFQAPGLFKSKLYPSVRAGRDLGSEDNIGGYKGEFAFEGNLQQIVLELKK